MRYFTGGYVKVPRSDALDVMLIGQTSALLVLHTLYAIAAYRTCDAKMGKKRVWLQPGQVVTTLREIMKLTGLSLQSTRTAVSTLRELQKINTVTNTNGLIVTVLNYETIQDRSEAENMPSNTDLTQAQHSQIATNTVSNQDESPPSDCNDDLNQEKNSDNNQNINTPLRIKEGKKEEESSLLSGGNYPARARPSDNDHHGERGLSLVKKTSLAQSVHAQTLLPEKKDDAAIARLVQLVKDHYDQAFRDDRLRGRGSGFDYAKANGLVATIVDEHGWERASEFGDYLFAYKRCARKQQIRLSEVPIIFERFKTGETIAELESRISR